MNNDDILGLPFPIRPGKIQQLSHQTASADSIGFFVGKVLNLGLSIKIIKRPCSLDKGLAGKDTAGLIGKENQLPAYFFCKKFPLPVDEDGTAAAVKLMERYAITPA